MPSPQSVPLERNNHLPNPACHVTPLIEVDRRLLAKLEFQNAAGSHKVRAARYIVRQAMADGDIIPGKTTVIEKTGGNFGLGLALACAEADVQVELAIGLSFSQIKRRCLERLGASLIGLAMLEKGATPREVVEWHLGNAGALGKHYFYTDQFHNPGNVLAHVTETGPEIARQLAGWPGLRRITLVAGAGTGASFTGICRGLRAHGYRVRGVLVEPAGCDSRAGCFVDHTLEGIAVGVSPPLMDWSLVHETQCVTHDAMIEAKYRFARRTGYLVGNTAAACLEVAERLAGRQPEDGAVLTLLYDHGLWYPT